MAVIFLLYPELAQFRLNFSARAQCDYTPRDRERGSGAIQREKSCIAVSRCKQFASDEFRTVN